MSSLFNSLGSNYSLGFVIKNLFSLPRPASAKKLKSTLAESYMGKVSLTYKGREALELAFRQSGLPAGSIVGINGFTCYVVYEAIKNAGYKPVFIDIAKGQLNFDQKQLKGIKNIKAVVVQNTLGYPANMPAIGKYCRQNGIMIVEDLAHSTGSTYANGLEAGTVGDFAMLSFSQDKPLDSVAGGALIDRRKQPTQPKPRSTVNLWQRFKVRTYPMWAGLIRSTYKIGLGRALHFALKKLKLLTTPMSDEIKGLHAMSSTTAGLVLSNWSALNSELEHRRQIAQIYQTELPKQLQLTAPKGQATYLRFPILVKDRQSLVSYLRKDNIYIGDTWYDAPIAPKRYMLMTDYKSGSCPESEKLASQIINLPTHRHVSPNQAAFVCAKIKQWLALQQKA